MEFLFQFGYGSSVHTRVTHGLWYELHKLSVIMQYLKFVSELLLGNSADSAVCVCVCVCACACMHVHVCSCARVGVFMPY
jgi:hypothetical protein